MEGLGTFVREVIGALRPVLPAETLDHVGFALETGHPSKALIEAISGAVTYEVTVPARMVDKLRDQLVEGSFGRRDARTLNRLLPRLRTDTGT